MGNNRFECRACPFEYALDRKWYDRTVMKEKEVEQVFGGKDEWANADSVEGKRLLRLYDWYGLDLGLIMAFAVQCPNEGCDSDRAYFYQLQIRSADEPMTTFLRVGDWSSLHSRRVRISDSCTVLHMYHTVERELRWRCGGVWCLEHCYREAASDYAF